MVRHVQELAQRLPLDGKLTMPGGIISACSSHVIGLSGGPQTAGQCGDVVSIVSVVVVVDTCWGVVVVVKVDVAVIVKVDVVVIVKVDVVVVVVGGFVVVDVVIEGDVVVVVVVGTGVVVVTGAAVEVVSAAVVVAAAVVESAAQTQIIPTFDDASFELPCTSALYFNLPLAVMRQPGTFASDARQKQ